MLILHCIARVLLIPNHSDCMPLPTGSVAEEAVLLVGFYVLFAGMRAGETRSMHILYYKKQQRVHWN